MQAVLCISCMSMYTHICIRRQPGGEERNPELKHSKVGVEGLRVRVVPPSYFCYPTKPGPHTQP